VVEHLVGTGRPTYLVEYGAVSFDDRDLTLAPWVEEVVPAAVRAASTHAGDRPVHLVGWSLGGIFALLTAASDPSLPVASVTALGTPFDLRDVPLVAPLRPLLTLPDQPLVLSRISQAVAQQSWVQWATGLSTFQRLVAKPLALALNLDDADYLAQLQAVDRFTSEMSAYRGRTFGQLYHRVVPGNGLADGVLDVGGRDVALAGISVPVLLVAGTVDQIAPVGAVKAGVPLLTGSPDVRFEIVPGGHLGMLTGREARDATWPVLDAWLDEWSYAVPLAPRRTPATAAKKSAKKTAKKTAATKTAPTKKTSAGKAPPGDPSVEER
jgi:polyhydroxyalkanoate synthase